MRYPADHIDMSRITNQNSTVAVRHPNEDWRISAARDWMRHASASPPWPAALKTLNYSLPTLTARFREPLTRNQGFPVAQI